MSDYVRRLRAVVGTQPLILVGSSVVVVDDTGRILLIQRTDTGEWGLPGGLTDPGESLEDTARREVVEETGVGIDQVALLDLFSGPECYYRCPNGDEVHNVTAAYVARVAGGVTVRADPMEARDARFFDLADLPAKIFPPEAPIVDRYVRTVRESTVD